MITGVEKMREFLRRGVELAVEFQHLVGFFDEWLLFVQSNVFQ